MHTEDSVFENRNNEESITDVMQNKELIEDKELGKDCHYDNEGEKKLLVKDGDYKMQLNQSLDHAV